MSTAHTSTANAAPDDCSKSIKLRFADRAMRFLFGQEAIVVLLVLILAAAVLGGVFIYRDMRADNREARADAVAKQEAARKEYMDQLAAERAAAAQTLDKNQQAFERFGDKVSGSIDRLADEIRRKP